MSKLLDGINDFFDESNLPELGPARRGTAMGKEEVETRCLQIASDLRLTSEVSDLLRSAILLWHDHLDSSHSLSQEIHSPNGSFLHAIMHRREPDYWNSKYWWRKVGPHPSFDRLANLADGLLSSPENRQLKQKLLPGGRWDPFAFVDAVEESERAKTARDLLKRLQGMEMRAFLETL